MTEPLAAPLPAPAPATPNGPSIPEAPAPPSPPSMAPAAPGAAPELPDGPPVPPDPLLALLHLPGPEAVRRVYQLAVAAARAKAQINASRPGDPQSYHALLSRYPEARFADVLLPARRRLDTLAEERQRLDQEIGGIGATGPGGANATSRSRASILELQSIQVTAAMEQIAIGVLLFLAMPEAPGAAMAEPSQQGQQGPGQPGQPQDQENAGVPQEEIPQ